MFTIEEFCYIMDDEKPDIIKELKKRRKVREKVEKEAEMNEMEKKIFNEHLVGLLGKYRKMKNWRKLLGTKLMFKRPYLANA